ncbi:MAG TPA: BatD family protein [Candidatus Limnocylindria bacterium]|nr:BatD family protein [Candidatus Limnocylindria bacterium]
MTATGGLCPPRIPRLALALAVALSLSLVGTPARAADPVNAAATVDRTSITVGDRIALSVLVDAAPGYAVSDPTIARQLGEFEVVQTQASQKTARGSQIRFTYRYVVTAWRVGDLVLPAIDVSWLGPDGAAGTARTADIPIAVTSVVAAGEDTSDIKPLKPQLGVPEAVWGRLARVAIGIVSAAALAGVVALALWLFLRRRSVGIPAERLTPAQRALRALDELSALRLPEQGRTAEHYERLTACLRRYAVERFGVAPGRTSRELRDALERAGLERAQAAAIYEILREGDEVRFRGATPYPAHALNAVRAALEVVRRAASADEYEIAALQPQ